MIDWRHYFLDTSSQTVSAKYAEALPAEDSLCTELHAKYAKGVDEGSGETAFADLHTNIESAPSLEDVLQDRAIELWSTSSGRLFLVADEEDARLAMERCRSRRGEIYTAAEMRMIIAVDDPASVAEIHDWKRRFDGAVREAVSTKPQS